MQQHYTSLRTNYSAYYYHGAIQVSARQQEVGEGGGPLPAVESLSIFRNGRSGTYVVYNFYCLLIEMFKQSATIHTLQLLSSTHPSEHW